MVYMMGYDIAFQCFFIPLKLWTGIQHLLQWMGLCGSLHGPYFEMLPAALFFVAIAFIDTFLFIAFSWI
jgi:hypothetical protein